MIQQLVPVSRRRYAQTAGIVNVSRPGGASRRPAVGDGSGSGMATKKRKSYDDKFRASAIVMLEAAGYPDKPGSLMYVANHLHVPHPTLSRWFNQKNNPAPNELVQEKRLELKDMLANELAAIFKAMPSVRSEASYRDLGTVAGILIDKKQLLEGKPTGIIDDASLTDTDRATRIATILDAARARRDGQLDSESDRAASE